MTEFKEDSNDCEETVGNNIISAFTMPETPGDNILPFVRKFELLNYPEVTDRRACSLKFFRFSFHPACNFSCNKHKRIHPRRSLFIDLISQ